jgi:hypothetical protein
VINFNEQLTQEQARYILEEVFPKRGYRIDNTTLGWWMKAHNYAFKEQVGIPGCSCEMLQTYNVWNSRLAQYEPQIRAVAYPPIVTQSGETGISNGKPKSSGKAGRKPKGNSGLTD